MAIHHTHIWSLEGGKNLLSAHIVISEKADYQEIILIKRQIREVLMRNGALCVQDDPVLFGSKDHRNERLQKDLKNRIIDFIFQIISRQNNGYCF